MNTAVTRSDWVGRVVDGRFPLLEWLGSSEKAGVFRTELAQPQSRRAAIRLLPVDGENPEDRLGDWASAARLSHPHLMRIFESGRTQVGGVDLLYVVTEYAEESLAQVIPERPLSTGEARAMLVPILDALAYLHGQGLVHGHLKPSNVAVVDDRIKLPVESVRPVTRPGRRSTGLEPYDAPEVASGAVSPAGDVWSMGITLVEALTQTLPEWNRSSKSDPPVPPEIPEPFNGIARACLRCEPASRSNVRQIMELLSGRRSVEEPGDKIQPKAAAEIADRAPKTSARKGMIVAAMVVMIALIAFLLLRSRPPRPAQGPSPPSETSAAPAQAAPATESAPAQEPPSTTAAPPAASAPATVPPPASPPVAQSPAPGGASAKGEVAQRVMPDVAASASRTIRGKVEVRVRLNVDASGAVSDASFDAQGPSHYFSAKALDAARKWQFKPAQANGQGVASIWVLRFDFRKDGPEVSVQQVSP